MFLCRERELEQLDKRYRKKGFECAIIYGRRRVGKTALINEFCKDKDTIFFSALKATEQENLESFSDSIQRYKEPASVNAPIFRDFSAALSQVTEIANKKRVILVIDEYPYLAKAVPSISSRLQHLIDHEWQDSRLFLILCGSSVSFMENEVLGYESPLYGRRTCQFKVEPMTYLETAEFNPSLPEDINALIYGLTGGIPHYIRKLDVQASIDEAIVENVLEPSCYLFEETENLLKQELREPAVYNSVIKVIAEGASKLNEIVTKSGIETGSCTKYVNVLINLGIVKKEIPVTEKPGKKTVYRLEDNFFRFWYRFIPRNMAALSAGKTSQVYEQMIREQLPDYMGLVFEKMCRQYLLYYDKELPFVLTQVGQWWGTDAKKKKEVQIDLVGVPAEGDFYLIGSCKYKNEKTGISELLLLQEYATVFGKGKKYYYYIFSKAGFTEELIKKTECENVRLITLQDMYKKVVTNKGSS